MPLTPRFYSVAQALFHPGMGTENVGPLLHSLTCMRRPETVIAVGLGYSTLFLLQALADVERERARDRQVLQGQRDDPARAEVLAPDSGDPPAALPRLIAIDDFSDDAGRLSRLSECARQLELEHLLQLHPVRYQDWDVPPGCTAGLVWIDCGHQLDYAPLCNRFWPLVDEDGGLLAMHYTYVDVRPAPDADAVVIPGPWVNAVKRDLGRCGPDAGFEVLSLVEPHKHRQGSVTLLRKAPLDRCRDNEITQEQRALYGDEGSALRPLNVAEE